MSSYAGNPGSNTSPNGPPPPPTVYSHPPGNPPWIYPPGSGPGIGPPPPGPHYPTIIPPPHMGVVVPVHPPVPQPAGPEYMHPPISPTQTPTTIAGHLQIPPPGLHPHPHPVLPPPHQPIPPPGHGLVPQTPPATGYMPPPPTGPEFDLPQELLAVGWRKFFSKRESRWYFWNCNTGESLWELPPLPGRPQPDAVTDPLGIHHGGVKRRASGEHLASPPVKKFILAGPWDLEISSNVYSSESVIPNPNLLPPHPEIESMRYQLVIKLRQCYQKSCQSREGIDAPKESLNRWFVERKLHDRRGIDPIFPSCDESEGVVSPLMYREIMNDIPMKTVKAKFTGDARKQLSKYADACKKIIETRNASAEARKIVKWKVEETFSWLRGTSGAPFEEFEERLAHLKSTCQPHVHEAAKSSVEGICKKMSVLAKQYATSVREAHLKLYVDPDAVKQDTKPEIGRFRCHPAVCGPYSFTDSGKLPTIEFMQQDRDHVLLKFKTDVVRLTTQYLQKLEQLYRYNCVDDRKFEFFLARCYSLLKRYNGFCEDFRSPHSSQGSIPITVMESIQRNFGVTFECFASPLNCYFRQYCSAFPDIDGYFGSRGTFLDFKPVAGSFQVNPPIAEDLIDSAITHVEDLLAGTKDALSFIIFVPDFVEDKEAEEFENECNWLKRLENSRWKRKRISVPSFDHEFRHGGQHLVQKVDVSIRSQHTTVIFWLQNDAGFDEWEPTDTKVDALIDAYRPGRERERDRQDLLAPERKNPQPADKAIAAMTSGSMPAA